MAKVEPIDGSRFVVITDPDFEPFFFDAAHVSAVEGRGEGRFALHLASGRTIQLQPPIAAAVLRQLGLPVPKAKPKAPKVKRAVKQPQTQGRLRQVWGFLTG